MKRPPHLLRYWNALRNRRGGAVAQKRRQKLRSLMQPAQTVEGRSPLDYLRLLLGIGTAAILSILLSIHLMPNHVSWHVGDTADREIVAPRTVRYVDSEATRILRDEAASQVEKRYQTIPGATSAARESVRFLFDHLETSQQNTLSAVHSTQVLPALPLASSPLPSIPFASPTPEKSEQVADWKRVSESLVREVQEQTATKMSAEPIAVLLAQSPETIRLAREVTLELVTKEMSRAITEASDELREAREGVTHTDALNRLTASAPRDAVAAIAAAALRPTRYYNAAETEREREAARSSVPTQTRRVTAGTVLLRAGDRITAQHIDQFTALGLQSSRPDALTISVITLLIFCLTGLVAAYLRQFHPEIYSSNPSLLLMAILSVISVAGLKVGSTLLGLSAPGMQFGYLGMMCVASAGMVIALLLSPRAALLVVALLSAVSGIILNNELRFALVTLASSLTGIVAVTTLKNRNDLVRAVLLLCGANAVLNILVGHLEGDVPTELGMSALWGVIAGVFALALFYFGVAIFEKWFGITTHLRLLELSDPATPLLQEFRLRVPGTYAHSLMVSNLAHAAAEAIGADALLVRVAAYYHDIGKMNRPEFFIENQSGMENIHDRLAPSLSAIILASHVKEGVEIATEIGLPPRVRELIEQHHGTTLMRYFYHRATQGVPNPMLEAQFRYPGPKPQSREAAILMLADSVEAASRTLQRPTPARIREFVGRMVEEKRADEQLTECDLTLRDLAMIEEVFTRTLCGALHARVEYPDEKRSAEPATLAVASVGGVAGVPSVRTSNGPLTALELPPSLEEMTPAFAGETKGPSPDLFPLLSAIHQASNESPLTTRSLPEPVPEELAESVTQVLPYSFHTEAHDLGFVSANTPFSEYTFAERGEMNGDSDQNGINNTDTARPKRSFLGHSRGGNSKAPRKRR